MAQIGEMTLEEFEEWVRRTSSAEGEAFKKRFPNQLNAIAALIYIVSVLRQSGVYSGYCSAVGDRSSSNDSLVRAAIGGERKVRQKTIKAAIEVVKKNGAIPIVKISQIGDSIFLNALYEQTEMKEARGKEAEFTKKLDVIFKLDVQAPSQVQYPACPAPGKLASLLRQNKQIILKGPPGTGKTRLAKMVAEEMVAEKMVGQSAVLTQTKLIQFHPSYAYEDFIMGLEVGADANGNITYEMKSRGLKVFADEAYKNQGKKFVLIIDEINRAQVSSVFGELMYALEYRGQPITLSSKEQMTIPENLYIIGTMNTADRSIAELDYAMQRRFAFQYIPPTKPVDSDLQKSGKVFLENLYQDVQSVFQKENVMAGIDPDDIRIGTSYFICNADPNTDPSAAANQPLPQKEHVQYKINYELIPLLTEYYKDGMFRKKKPMFVDDTNTFQYYLQEHREKLVEKLEDLQ